MKHCPTCGKQNNPTARFCEECGGKFVEPAADIHETSQPAAVQINSSGVKASSITSVGIPPIVEPNGTSHSEVPEPQQVTPLGNPGVHAMLLIERGGGANSEFPLSNEDSQIGRWDADNGIFPDVDLDAFDADAKVSRRHARIIYKNGAHMVEDLGSTNGTFVNRGRRLLPGSPQILNDGDEIIVGKTFLRFRVK